MIRINLLPPEYRARPGTPMARFVALVAGIVLVLSATGAYAYTHFIQLENVKKVRDSRQAEAQHKERQRDRSLALQKEIDRYENRRLAIRTINRSRTLWSRKLDQFFDIVTGQGRSDASPVWLEDIKVPQKITRARKTRKRSRRKRRGAKLEPGGELRTSGYIAMNEPSEALTALSAFHNAITGDPENSKMTTEFFADFMGINNPNIEMQKMLPSQEEEQRIPPAVGSFNYKLLLKPIDLAPKSKGKARKSAAKKR